MGRPMVRGSSPVRRRSTCSTYKDEDDESDNDVVATKAEEQVMQQAIVRW
jgi:hypothetical protein